MPQSQPSALSVEVPALVGQPARQTGWLTDVWLACLLGLLTASAAWTLRFDFLQQDGEKILSLFTAPWHARPHWYHVLHLETARALGLLGLSPYDSLRATSALYAGVSVAALAALFAASVRGSSKSPHAAWVLLLCTPAFWFHARLIEVHTAQLFGAVLVSWAAWLAAKQGLLLRGLLVFAGVSLGALLHRANLLLAAPLAAAPAIRAWMAGRTPPRAGSRSPASGGEPDARTTDLNRLGFPSRYAQPLANLAGALLALPLLQWAWSASSMGPEKGAWEMNLWLLVSFWKGISAQFLWNDLLFGLPCAPLVLVSAATLLMSAPKSLSEFELFSILAAVFLVCFYTLFGETTRGGYMLGIAPAACGALSASLRAWPATQGSRWLRPAFVGTCLAGAWVAVAHSEPEAGPPLEQAMRLKREGLRALREELGVPICVLSSDPAEQVVNGQIEGLYEICLFPILKTSSQAGHALPDVIASTQAAVIARLRPYGLPVLLTGATEQGLDFPLLAEAERLLEQLFVAELGAEPRSLGPLRLQVPSLPPVGP